MQKKNQFCVTFRVIVDLEGNHFCLTRLVNSGSFGAHCNPCDTLIHPYRVPPPPSLLTCLPRYGDEQQRTVSKPLEAVVAWRSVKTLLQRWKSLPPTFQLLKVWKFAATLVKLISFRKWQKLFAKLAGDLKKNRNKWWHEIVTLNESKNDWNVSFKAGNMAGIVNVHHSAFSRMWLVRSIKGLQSFRLFSHKG